MFLTGTGDQKTAVEGGDGANTVTVNVRRLDASEFSVKIGLGSTVGQLKDLVAYESGIELQGLNLGTRRSSVMAGSWVVVLRGSETDLTNRQQQDLNTNNLLRELVNPPEIQNNQVPASEIFAGDNVSNLRTKEIGVVSADRHHFLPVARYAQDLLVVEDVRVVGRDFRHGDTVAYATERTKVGRVVGVKKCVDLAHFTGETAYFDIDTVHLARTQSLYCGDFVISVDGSWIGVIEDTYLRAKVRTEDGEEPVSLNPVPKNGVGFHPIYYNMMEESIGHPYYLGQAVNCGWQDHGRFVDGITNRGIVVEQDVQQVSVNWLPPGLAGSEKPTNIITPKNLRRLECSRFDRARWKIGERCFYDGLVCLVVNLRTKIAVKWQDGASSEVDGIDVVPLDNAEALFFCGQMVCHKAQVDEEEGVVLSVMGNSVRVKWLVDREDVVEHVKTEELELVPKHNFNIEGIVVRSNTSPYYGVVDQRDGHVQVDWLNETVSLARFDEIQRLPLTHGHEADPVMGEDDHAPDADEDNASASDAEDMHYESDADVND